MKKQITITTLGVLMMSLAIAMYGGESMTFETNLTNPVYTVTGNESNLEGLNVTFNNGNIEISPALNYKPDNFTLIFFDNQTREVEKIVYRGGGGGSSTKYIDRNVTVYVPEYITTIVGPEEIVDLPIAKTKFIYNGYEAWHIAVGTILGAILGWILTRKREKDDRG